MTETTAVFSRSAPRLTDLAVTTMLQAAINAATAMQQPQCIAIVDASGIVLAHFRMDGAKFLSLRSALSKAETAASINAPSNSIPAGVASAIAAATGGGVTSLPGGLPIRVDGHLVGGIGVGSGTGSQDLAVAMAALSSIGAATFQEPS